MGLRRDDDKPHQPQTKRDEAHYEARSPLYSGSISDEGNERCLFSLISQGVSWEAVAGRSKCLWRKATARRVDSAVSGMGRGRPT